MQYIAWPDHGVPDSPTEFLSFTQRVRAARAGMVEPTLIHCSAGIGRFLSFFFVTARNFMEFFRIFTDNKNHKIRKKFFKNLFTEIFRILFTINCKIPQSPKFLIYRKNRCINFNGNSSLFDGSE